MKENELGGERHLTRMRRREMYTEFWKVKPERKEQLDRHT
jgi:hypothetical protein